MPWRMPARASAAVLAVINTIFVQENAEAASAQWRSVADQLRTSSLNWPT